MEPDVFRRRWQPFLTSDDVRDVHQTIVNNVCQMICWKTIRFHQNEISLVKFVVYHAIIVILETDEF